MRIDKFLTNTGTATRKEAAAAAKSGQILVDGKVCKRADTHIDPEKNIIHYRGEIIVYRKFTYIMLNKPDGFISATEDSKERTVMELLPQNLQRMGLFPCGRLDKDTVGLLILTNNGQLAHRLLSPRSYVSKEYRFKALSPISAADADRLCGGVELDDGYITLPAKIRLEPDAVGGVITVVEGKYHQIKRMFEAIGNKIIFLERISFASILLDTSIDRGKWRYLTEEEISSLEAREDKNITS